MRGQDEMKQFQDLVDNDYRVNMQLDSLPVATMNSYRPNMQMDSREQETGGPER